MYIMCTDTNILSVSLTFFILLFFAHYYVERYYIFFEDDGVLVNFYLFFFFCNDARRVEKPQNNGENLKYTLTHTHTLTG